jgi:dienelactone hydrolase
MEAVQFTTADGFVIGGTWYSDRDTGGRLPVVILLHTATSTHTLWTPIVPDLIAQGYRVLAFDIRGYALSRYQNGEFRPVSQFETPDFDAMPLDIGGAIAYIGTRPDADPQHIAAVGVGLGANIAYVSSGLYADLTAAVAVSVNARDTDRLPLGEDIPDLDPHGILFMASFGDGYAYTSSETLAARTRAPVRVSGYQGAASGVFLLNQEAARDELIGWLRDHL